MSLFRSILNSASPPRGYSQAYSRTQKYERELELPLYSSPPPNIPSPITKSTYRQPHAVVDDLHASTLRLEQGQQKSDDMLRVQREEEYLQRRLQELLDVQADGLLAGLSAQTENDGGIKSGSSTPTAHALRTPSRSTSSRRPWNGTRSPSPPIKGPRLKYARREIYRTIRQLSSLKSTEDEYLQNSQQDDESVLQRIDAWERKRVILEREMTATEQEEGGQDVEDLQGQAEKLDGEIQELEIRLAQMKTRHRQLLAELEEVDNNVQSKLASYRSSLAMLDKEIKGFLERSPESGDHSTFAKLPPNRRTLELAKDHYHDRLNQTERLLKDSQMERDALDDGALVWKEVVETLEAFEITLKTEMLGLSQERDEHALDTKTKDILLQMEPVLSSLETKLELARQKEWQLLVCCIGAELEAFKQGKELLEDLINPSDARDVTRQEPAMPSNVQSPNRNSPLKRSRVTSPPVKIATASESDDDPDPELLITHQQDLDD